MRLSYVTFVALLLFVFSCGQEEEVPLLTLTVLITPENGGSVQIEPDRETYEPDESVTLIAQPNEFYEFVSWRGDVESSESSVEVIFDDSHISVLGTFQLKDTDGDGITDDVDTCSDTPSGSTVDENGCADSQKDSDGDGVTDDIDICASTPDGATVDENGCAESQKDTDGDGVTDDLDICPDTPDGELTDETGCIDYIYIPDNGFELSLIYSGIDDIQDNRVKASNIINVTELFLGQFGLKDLTGLSEFVNLVRLGISDLEQNELTLPELPHLTIFGISSQNLTSIDFKNVPLLAQLEVRCSELNQISLINNSNLIDISITESKLTEFVSTETLENLEKVYITGIYLENVDLSFCKNIGEIRVGNIWDSTYEIPSGFVPVRPNIVIPQSELLEKITLYYTNISSIDLSHFNELKNLILQDNMLSSLDVSSNIILTHLDARQNPLTCIQVNSNQLGTVSDSWRIDEEDRLSLDCGN